MKKKQKITLYRIIITAVMLVVLQFLPITGIPRLIAYLAAYLVIGYDILRKAGKGILNGRAFDENFLMALATLGAFFLAIWTKSGDYLEGIAVMLFYQIGELFQSYAVGKSRKNISALMDIRPDYANIEKDGKLEQVDPDEVAVGSIIVVQPGEKVPLDGVVESGNASLNTSALTGESLPRDVKEGDEIISGCINLASPPFPKSSTSSKTPVPASPVRKRSSPASLKFTPRRSAFPLYCSASPCRSCAWRSAWMPLGSIGSIAR